jgi:hypothetical protein
MPRWLVDEPSTIYLILGFVGLGLLFAFWKTRDRRWAIGLGVVVALIGLVWLLGYLIVSDSKQIQKNLEEMAAGVKAKDLDRTFAHISDQFNVNGLTKAGLRNLAERVMRNGLIDEITIWDYEVGEVSRSNRTGKIAFKVKITGPQAPREPFYSCKADFVLDPDYQWRLRSFVIYHPVNNEPLRLPRY